MGSVFVSGGASLASPAFTGTPTAPTADPGTTSNQIATTSFVATALQNTNQTSIGFCDGDGVIAITTGQKGYVRLPYLSEITGWSIVCAGSSPTCTVDVWKIGNGTALPTVANTIMGTKPALTTGNILKSTTLTGWTTVTVAEGDTIGFNLDAVANATFIEFKLYVTKS